MNKRDLPIFTIKYYHNAADQVGYEEVQAESAGAAKAWFENQSCNWREDCTVLDVLMPAYIGAIGSEYIRKAE